MKSKILISFYFLLFFTYNSHAASKKMSKKDGKDWMVQQIDFVRQATKKGEYYFAGRALIDMQDTYHDFYSNLPHREKFFLKRRMSLFLSGMTLNKWITFHMRATWDSFAHTKKICEECEHCKSIVKPSPRAGAEAESKSQAIRKGSSTLERYERSVKEQAAMIVALQKKLEEKEKTIQFQSVKVRKVVQEKEELEKLIQDKGASGQLQFVMPVSSIATNLVPTYPAGVVAPMAAMTKAMVVTPRKHNAAFFKKNRTVSFGLEAEKATFDQEEEPQTPMSATLENVHERGSIERDNRNRSFPIRLRSDELRRDEKGKKKGLRINPLSPSWPRLQPSPQMPPPSFTGSTSSILQAPVADDADEIPPPPETTPPSSLVGDDNSSQNRKPRLSASLYRPLDSPSTIRRNTIAANLNLGVYDAPLPPSPRGDGTYEFKKKDDKDENLGL